MLKFKRTQISPRISLLKKHHINWQKLWRVWRGHKKKDMHIYLISWNLSKFLGGLQGFNYFVSPFNFLYVDSDGLLIHCDFFWFQKGKNNEVCFSLWMGLERWEGNSGNWENKMRSNGLTFQCSNALSFAHSTPHKYIWSHMWKYGGKKCSKTTDITNLQGNSASICFNDFVLGNCMNFQYCFQLSERLSFSFQ